MLWNCKSSVQRSAVQYVICTDYAMCSAFNATSSKGRWKMGEMGESWEGRSRQLQAAAGMGRE
jgi:hypothetical protein